MKSAAKYPLAFFACAALCLALLLGAALIPRGALEKNMRASAEYLTGGKMYSHIVEGVKSSRIDHYADAILLNIAWCYDASRPMESVMLSSYYDPDVPGQMQGDNLLAAVTRGEAANKQYLRYWHGSIALVRPLMTVLTLPQLYALHGVLLAALTVWLLAALWRRGERAAACGVLAGELAATFFLAPLSLEYTWVCLLTLVFSLLSLRLARKERWARAPLLFLVCGVVTNFLDFLTAETLTLTAPLLLLLWLRRRDKAAEPVKTAWTAALAWGCGYAGMWLLKWLLASLTLGESALPYVAEHVEHRLGGAAYDADALHVALGAIPNNIACLFPVGWGTTGVLATVALVLGAAGYVYVHLCKGWNKTLLLTCAAVGFVPYVRYLVLRNHSYIHCFFACRAQAATVLAIALILAELTERRRDDGGKRRKRA